MTRKGKCRRGPEPEEEKGARGEEEDRREWTGGYLEAIDRVMIPLGDPTLDRALRKKNGEEIQKTPGLTGLLSPTSYAFFKPLQINNVQDLFR